MIPTAEEILEKNVNDHRIASKTDPTNIKRIKEEVFYKSMNEFAKISIIEELKKHIEHPTKPGYKRQDIIDRIKELES
jgi:hypothetical protein